MNTKNNSKKSPKKIITKKPAVSLRTEKAKNSLQELRKITEFLIPRYDDEVWNIHSLATINAGSLARILYLNNLYQQIINVPGVICEFGVQWGATLTQLINLRSIYEPFNLSRTIYGFDTFNGFKSIHEKDGVSQYKPGDFSTLENYDELLERLLHIQESFPPLSHIKKYKLIKGDATETIDTWLQDNPHAIISLAIFDMDLYEPTKLVLEKILPRLVKGSVIAFDELNCPVFPGETRAVDEIIGLNNLRLRRIPLSPYACWAVFGD